MATKTKTAKTEAPATEAPATKTPPGRIARDAKITITKPDAKLRGSRAERFALVRDGMTVEELAAALKAGGFKVSAGGMTAWLVEAGIARLD